MGFLFGGGGDGGAAARQLEEQKKTQAKAEEKQLKQETKFAQQEQGRLKSRARGATRPLLASVREDSELGIQDQTKLGGGSYMS